MRSRFGFWAAVVALMAALGYAVPQLLQAAGILHDPWDRIFIFAPSLLLAPSFVTAMAALHVVTPQSRHAYSLSGLAIAIMYGTLVSLVYITQLNVVIPHDLAGDGGPYAIFACCGTHQFTTGIDLLGYMLMSVATLLAAGAFTASSATAGWSRWTFIANGILAPFLLFQLLWPWLIYVGALWLITFPAAMIALALFFRAPDGTSNEPSSVREAK